MHQYTLAVLTSKYDGTRRYDSAEVDAAHSGRLFYARTSQ